MDQGIRLTVVVVTSNCSENIIPTLLSISSHPQRQIIEVVIIDNCSTDNTLEHVRHFLPSSRIVSEPDSGIYDAMNKGLALATGEWVFFLNSGDQLVKNFPIHDLLNNCETYSCIVCDTFLDNGIYHRNPTSLLPVSLLYRTMNHQALLYKTEVLRLFPFDTSFRFVSDQDQLLRLLRNNLKVKRCPKAICYWESVGFCSTNQEEMSTELDQWRRSNFGFASRVITKAMSFAKLMIRH